LLYRVLLVHDDPDARKRFRRLLLGPGTVVRVVATRRNLWSRLARESADLVIVDATLIPRPTADSITVLRESPDSPDVLVVSSDHGARARAELIAAGALAVVPRDLARGPLTELLGSMRAERLRLAASILRRPSVLGEPRLSDFVSASPTMQAFMDVVERMLESDATLLLTGETGVGKERLARAIHAEGRRSTGPFVAVNCAALPDQLIESELFGHAEGAFTGATRARRGWFELAHGGTLFLDEIGDMPLALQPKLLRAVQEHEFQPLGSERSIAVDVRIVAASNHDLDEQVQQRTFRRDLFYRLSVVTLAVPPLRDRVDDIPELAAFYVEHFLMTSGSRVESISREAVDALVRYSWPGNVRELRNVVERAVLLCDGPIIGLEDLPNAISSLSGGAAPGAARRLAAVLGALGEGSLERPWKEVRSGALEEVERKEDFRRTE
jgi:DNA-binding NtrC family response regulator